MTNQTFRLDRASSGADLVRAGIRRHVSTLGIAGHAIGAFIAFSIGAAIRHYLTGETPASGDLFAVTLWGWPAGAPLYLAAAYIARPLS